MCLKKMFRYNPLVITTLIVYRNHNVIVEYLTVFDAINDAITPNLMQLRQYLLLKHSSFQPPVWSRCTQVFLK